jgi:hypothetical protein
MIPENIEGPFAETSKTSLERHFNVHQNVQSLSYETLRKLLQDCRDESEKEAAESGEDDDDDDEYSGAMNIPAVAENVAAMKTVRKFSRTSLEKKSETHRSNQRE